MKDIEDIAALFILFVVCCIILFFMSSRIINNTRPICEQHEMQTRMLSGGFAFCVDEDGFLIDPKKLESNSKDT